MVESEWQRNGDAVARCQILRPLLRHLVFVADFVEKFLSHGTRRELSRSLVDEVKREFDHLGIPDYRVVMAHGSASNFETSHGDVLNAFLGPVSSGAPAQPEPFSFFRLPRFEGSSVPWRPALLGHEAAHVAIPEHNTLTSFGLAQRFDVVAGAIDNPIGQGPTAAIGLFRIATAWLEELVCDAHALRRFGPSAVASLAEYLTSLNADMAPSRSHPHGLLRIHLLAKALGQPTTPRLSAVVQPWMGITDQDVEPSEPWARYLTGLFLNNAADLTTCASSLTGPSFDENDASSAVLAIADRLKEGVPGTELVSRPAGLSDAHDVDVINASWVARSEDADAPLNRLGTKALENLDFVRRWKSAGGVVPTDLYNQEPLGQWADAGGVLTRDALIARLKADDNRRLEVLPALQYPEGAGLDLRLSNRFISFRRTGVPTFDPLAKADPRSMQLTSELAWTEQFVLHPHEMVLGSTLEYLVMPVDLTAQVISRSSYGRLGLLTATAVQVHPGFKGCLTLELVNLSNVPLTLTPGERIAQLVVSRTEPVTGVPVKYTCPIGPEFSRVRDDHEAKVLRKIRRG